MNIRLRLGILLAAMMLMERMHHNFWELKANVDPNYVNSLNNVKFKLIQATGDAPAEALRDPAGNAVCVVDFNGQHAPGHERNKQCFVEAWGRQVRNRGDYSFVLAPKGQWLPYLESIKFLNNRSRTPLVFIMNNGARWQMGISATDGIGAKTHFNGVSYGVNQNGQVVVTGDLNRIKVFVPDEGPFPIDEATVVNKDFKYVSSLENPPDNALKDPKGNLVCAYLFDDRRRSNDGGRYQFLNGYVHPQSQQCLFEAWGLQKADKGSYYYVIPPAGKWVPMQSFDRGVLNQPRTPVTFELKNPIGIGWKTGICAIDGIGAKTHFDQAGFSCWGVVNNGTAPTGVTQNTGRLQIYLPDAVPVKSPAETHASSIFSKLYSFAPSTQEPPADVIKDDGGRPMCTFMMGNPKDHQFFGSIGYVHPQTKNCMTEAWGTKTREPGQYHYLEAKGVWSRLHELTVDLFDDPETSLFVYQMDRSQSPREPKWKVGPSMVRDLGARQHDVPGNWSSYYADLNGRNLGEGNRNVIKYFVPEPKTHIKSPDEAYASSVFNKKFQFAPSDKEAPADVLKDEKGNPVCAFVFDARRGGLGDNNRFIGQVGHVKDQKCMTEAWGVHARGKGRWHYIIAPKGKWVKSNEITQEHANNPTRSPVVFRMQNDKGHKFDTAIGMIDGLAARTSEPTNSRANSWGVNAGGNQVGSNDPNRVKVYLPDPEPVKSPAEQDPESIFSPLFSFAPSADNAEPPADVIKDDGGRPLCTFLYGDKKVRDYLGTVGFVHPQSKQCLVEAWGVQRKDPGEYHYLVAKGVWSRWHELTVDLLDDKENSLFIYKMEHGPHEKWKVLASMVNGIGSRVHDIPGYRTSSGANLDGGRVASDNVGQHKFFVPEPKTHIKSPAETHASSIFNKKFQFAPSDQPVPGNVLKDEKGNPICAFVYDARRPGLGDNNRLMGQIGYAKDQKCFTENNGVQIRGFKRWHYVIAPKGKWVKPNEITQEHVNDPTRSPLVFKMQNDKGTQNKSAIAMIDGVAAINWDMPNFQRNTWGVNANGSRVDTNDVNRVRIYLPDPEPIPSPAETHASSIFSKLYSFAPSVDNAAPPADVIKDDGGRPMCTFMMGKPNEHQFFGAIGYVHPQTKNCMIEAWGTKTREPALYHYLVAKGSWVRWYELTDDLLDDPETSLFVYQMDRSQSPKEPKWKIGPSMVRDLGARQHDIPQNWNSYYADLNGKNLGNGDRNIMKYFVPEPKTHIKNPAEEYASSHFNKHFRFVPSDQPVPYNVLKDEKGNAVCTFILSNRKIAGANDRFLAMFGYVDGKGQCLAEGWGAHARPKMRYHYVVAPAGKWVPINQINRDLLNDPMRSPYVFKMQNDKGTKWESVIAQIDGFAARSCLGQTGDSASGILNGAPLGTKEPSRVKIFMPELPEATSIAKAHADSLIGANFEFASSKKPAPSNALKDPKGNYVCAFVFDERKTNANRFQIIFGHVLADSKQCTGEAWGVRRYDEGQWEYVIPPLGKWVPYTDITEEILENKARTPVVAEMIGSKAVMAIAAIDGLGGKTHMNKYGYTGSADGKSALATNDLKRVQVYLPDDMSKLPLDQSRIINKNFEYTYLVDSPGVLKNPEGQYVCLTTIDGQTQFAGVRDGRCYVHMSGKPQSDDNFYYVTAPKGTWKRLNEVSKDYEILKKLPNSPIAMDAQHGSVGACTYKGSVGKTHFGHGPCYGVDEKGNLFQAVATDAEALVFVPDPS